jgi:hypothetical protein
MKHILDEATRKALFGMVPFSCEVTTNFTPEEFSKGKIPSEFHPIFSIRSFSQSEMSQLKQNSQKYTKDSTAEEISKISNDNFDLVSSCVTGWSNLVDAGTMEDIAYSKEAFKTLPSWMKVSIMGFVKKISGLTPVEELSF